MFQVGDYVVYGCKGVCQVKEITTMKMDGIPKGKLYYQLQPCAQAASRIFTPVEPGNNKSVMRAVLTRQEASRLLEESLSEEEWIKDDRVREAKYKEIINGCDAVSLLKMIRMPALSAVSRRMFTLKAALNLQISSFAVKRKGTSIPMWIPAIRRAVF